MHWIIVLFFVFIAGASAQEHPACHDLQLSEPAFTSKELLTIARSCSAPEVAELYFNRAQHIRLLNRYIIFEKSLINYGNRESEAYIESYKVHMALVEAFFSKDLLSGNGGVVLAELNRIYEQSSEIAELRFKGYDLIADRLQQKYQL
ncbi:MAG: hypothetical protein ABW104_14645 [Candidatus Thiodiazotropha sp. 6PLUC2]